MQTIYLDISNLGVIPVIYAKQGDVGRKVEVILTNSGLPYEPEAGSAFSAWFSGASGVGNYTDIGDRSAFSVSGNKVTVELITQMLQNAGEGILCLVLSRSNGEQIGLWNIRYICEGIPGAGSEPAKDYYTAFSEAVAGLASLKGNATAARSASGEVISVSDSDHLPLNGLKIYGKTTQNGTPTPENPVELESVGKSGAINTKVCGKNLYDVSTAMSISPTAVLERNGDIFRLYNVSSSAYASTKADMISLKAGISYTLSYELISYVSGVAWLALRDTGNVIKSSVTKTTPGKHSVQYTPTEDMEVYVSVFCTGKDSAMGDITFRNAQLEVGSTATEYEPYKDGGSVTAQTPNGLPGIPVSFGGNYTDENGQQWICDEIDFARGVYVQRIGTYTTGSTTQWYKNGGDSKYIGTNNIHLYFPIANIDITIPNVICSSFQFYKYTGIGNEGYLDTIYNITGQKNVVIDVDKTLAADYNAWVAYVADNPFTVQYVLATPIETPISAEEMAAYAALHTNKPNTTVYNDAGAWMEMKYYTSNAAVPVNIGGGASGKVLGIDEHGCVVPKTLAQIGAAPAGYGYGEPCVSFYHTGSDSIAQFESALDEFVAGMKDGEAKQICVACDGITNTTLYGTIYRHTEQYVIVTLTTYYQNGSVVKCKFNGVWEPHGWVNPHMVPGVEYRTTERWNGKVVYAKAIDCGVLPNTNTKIVAWTPDSGSCTSVIGYGGTTIGYGALPNTIAGIELSVNTANIMIKTNADRSSGTAVVWVKYTKD